MLEALAAAHLETHPAGPAPRLKLDSTREFGVIAPPEQLVCAGGKFVPTAYREERPLQYAEFMSDIQEMKAAGRKPTVEYKTRCYEQDGFSFDADGQSIEECMDVAAHHRAREMQARQVAERAAREAHRKAMAEAGFDDATFAGFAVPKYVGPVSATDAASNPNDGPVRAGAPKVENDFDVIGWAQGRVQAHWFTVQKAINEKYAYKAANKEQALAWLRDNGVLQAIV